MTIDREITDDEHIVYSVNATLLDNDIKPKLNYKNEILASLVFYLTFFATGLMFAYSSPTLDDLLAEGHLQSEEQASWFASIATLGGVIGLPTAGYMMEKVGRRFSLMFSAAPFTIGWLCIVLDDHYSLLLVGRSVTGLGAGVGILSAIVYVAEISSPRIRGILASICHCSFILGVLSANSLGMVLTWRWLAVVSSMSAALLAPLAVLLPESPRWLCEHRSIEETTKALHWLRGRHYPVDEEYNRIRASVEFDKTQGSVSIRDLFTDRSLRTPLLLCLALMIFQQFSGINTITLFAKPIFENAGFGGTNSKNFSSVAAIVLALAQLVGCIIACCVVDKIGRRILLLFSGISMGLGMTSMGIFYYLTLESVLPPAINITWLSLLSLLVCMVAYNVGVGPLTIVLLGELVPGKAKGLVGSIASVVGSFSTFIVAFVFLPLETALHPYGAFWFFAGICFLNVLFVAVFLPETKGRTLEDIEKSFS